MSITYNYYVFAVCPGKPADIVFVIDESSSIWPVHFGRLRQFIVNLTDSFDVGLETTRIAAVSYSDKVTHRFSLDDYKNGEDVKKAVRRIDQKTGGILFVLCHRKQNNITALLNVVRRSIH